MSKVAQVRVILDHLEAIVSRGLLDGLHGCRLGYFLFNRGLFGGCRSAESLIENIILQSDVICRLSY